MFIKKINLIWLILPFAVLLSGCDLLPKASQQDSDEAAQETASTPGSTESNLTASEIEAGEEVITAAIPQYAGLVSENGEIRVISPGIDDVISSPVAISGRARTFENTVMIRIKDGEDNILAETTITTSAPDVGEFGDFRKSVTYDSPKTLEKAGLIEIFEQSMKDGQELSKVTIPVGFIK